MALAAMAMFCTRAGESLGSLVAGTRHGGRCHRHRSHLNRFAFESEVTVITACRRAACRRCSGCTLQVRWPRACALGRTGQGNMLAVFGEGAQKSRAGLGRTSMGHIWGTCKQHLEIVPQQCSMRVVLYESNALLFAVPCHLGWPVYQWSTPPSHDLQRHSPHLEVNRARPRQKTRAMCACIRLW